MKKIILIAVAIFSLAIVFTACSDNNKETNTEQLSKDEMYTCTMHNEVMSDHPGECPKCGCCKNKYQFFKVKDKHVTADDISSPVKHIIDLHSFTSSFHRITFATQKITIASRSNAPPSHPGVPDYIYNCVFRI